MKTLLMVMMTAIVAVLFSPPLRILTRHYSAQWMGKIGVK